MLRTLSAVGVSLGVLLTASLARAQANSAHGFGQQGEFIFSADRLVPFFAYTNKKQDSLNPPPGTTQTVTDQQTNLSFFWGSTNPNEIFYTVPRVGFDYTIVDNVTIGGDLLLFFTLGGSESTHTASQNQTTDVSLSSPGSTTFGIAPRGGYVLGLSDLFALWLRGGFSYYTQNQSQDLYDGMGNKIGNRSDSHWVFALDLDPQFVIVPMQHFAFTVGPAIDIPLTGKFSETVQQGGTSTTTTVNYSEFGFSVTAGLLGWLGG